MTETIPHYEEAAGSPIENFDQGSTTATRILYCNWNDRFAVKRAIQGSVYPWIEVLKCVSVQISPYSGAKVSPAPTGRGDETDVRVAVYDWAELTCEYELTPTPEQEEDAPYFIGETLTPTMEAFKAPVNKAGKSRYDSEDVNGNAEIRRPEHNVIFWSVGAEYTRSYSNLYVVPPELIGYNAAVNKDRIVAVQLNQVFEPETLLWVPGSATKELNEDNEERWRVDYKLIWKDHGPIDAEGNLIVDAGAQQIKEHAGWNHVWFKGKWVRLVEEVADNKFEVRDHYRQLNFVEALQPPIPDESKIIVTGLRFNN